MAGLAAQPPDSIGQQALLSLTGLRLALGDERANAFISNIGTAALRAAPAGLNISLETIVAATLGRLTQEDIAGIARGETSAISRAQAFAEDQVKALQGSQTGTNTQGAISTDKIRMAMLQGAGQWINGVWVSAEAGNDSTRSNGSRYDELGTKTDWSSSAGQARMREYAIQHGLAWAASNPDLLRLGPAAIQTLAEVQLKQTTYERLTRESAFEAKDVVAMARFAKEKKIDASQLGDAIADANKGLTAEEMRRHNEALMDVMMAKPGNESAAQERLNKVQEDLGRAHPQSKPQFDKVQELLKPKIDKEASTRQEAGAKEARTDQTEAAAKALFDGPSAARPQPQTGDPKAVVTAAVSAPAPGK